jgi:zinc D-Ala-D-Ala dipeptidase
MERDLDFVDVTLIDSSIVAEVRYATTNNFTGRVLYRSATCFLRRGVAMRLSAVQESLRSRGLGLKIFDGYRPRSVQRILWEILPDRRYVADPEVGSKHNRGAAVDVTLIDRAQRELLMPTPFDDFTVKAHSDYMDLSEEILTNRALLHNAMREGGFVPLPTEWWHFDVCDWERYPLEDKSDFA